MHGLWVAHDLVLVGCTRPGADVRVAGSASQFCSVNLYSLPVPRTLLHTVRRDSVRRPYINTHASCEPLLSSPLRRERRRLLCRSRSRVGCHGGQVDVLGTRRLHRFRCAVLVFTLHAGARERSESRIRHLRCPVRELCGRVWLEPIQCSQWVLQSRLLGSSVLASPGCRLGSHSGPISRRFFRTSTWSS